MLSLACEAFRYLLFPFYWQFVFIPLLPERLLNCLQAPVPYIIGFQGDLNDIDEIAPDDVRTSYLITFWMDAYDSVFIGLGMHCEPG